MANNVAHLVNGETALEAWRQGVQLLLSVGEVYHLVTTVAAPIAVDVNWFQHYDPSGLTPGMQSLSEVAMTIFPHKLANRGYTRQQLYDRYTMLHARAKRIHPKRGRRWGTYFDRMIRFGSGNINQLERVIGALLAWHNNPKAALVIHTSSADTDKPKPIGGPCLQYVEFLCPSPDSLSLLAVYRNHDFFGKALGNFIGLGQLLQFVCRETNRAPGTLVCHSAHAYFESSKTKVKSLADF